MTDAYWCPVFRFWNNVLVPCSKTPKLTLSGPAFQSFARGLRGPDAKNQGKNQPIEIKLCMSHYIYKSILDAKFETDSFLGLEI